jgi:transcriptional regulator with XRE-family HTH domain
VTSRDDAQDSRAAAIIRLRPQAKLAREVGVAERTVKRWERGVVPQPKHRPALIRLGVDAQLFERAEEKEQIEKRLRSVEGEIARIRALLV